MDGENQGALPGFTDGLMKGNTINTGTLPVFPLDSREFSNEVQHFEQRRKRRYPEWLRGIVRTLLGG